jgi:hypothetical protein
MREGLVAVLVSALLTWAGAAHANDTGSIAHAEGRPAAAGQSPWWDEDEPSKVRGYLGGLLAAGVGANGQLDSVTEAYVDTSLLFALRGGLLLGKGNRWLLGLELAPLTNRLDWRLGPTATGFVSFGSLVSIKESEQWAWLWKIGFGAGGGFDYRFLVAVQIDVLTFNYKMSDRLWVDLGIPTIRFHIETADRARYNVQFVFPLGITFAI